MTDPAPDQPASGRGRHRGTARHLGTPARVVAGALTSVICLLIAWHVYIKVDSFELSALTGVYTILISSYVLSRFLLSAFYRPPRDVGLEPPVAIVVPAFNEGEAVARTIHSCLSLDYPADKLEVVVINDGSTDDTWDHMVRAAAEYPAGAVRCVDLGSNQGKRAAMAAGIRATSAEILVFVDSDSIARAAGGAAPGPGLRQSPGGGDLRADLCP